MSLFSAITCSPIADPINGTVIYSTEADGLGNYVFNVTANHSCDTEFTLVGNNPRTCSGDGSSITGAFDGEDLKCEGANSMSVSDYNDNKANPTAHNAFNDQKNIDTINFKINYRLL